MKHGVSALFASRGQRVQVASPIPPIRSGTAIYMKHFIESHVPEADREHLELLCDIEDFHNGVPPCYMGAAVLDYRQVDYSRPLLLFIANNEFHRFCHRLLAACNPSNTYVVIHEPCCLMLVEWMCLSNYYPYSRSMLRSILREDYGERAADYFSSSGYIPEILKFNTVGLHPKLHEVRCIYVHSRFARSKLAMDRRIDKSRIQVINHPPNVIGRNLPYNESSPEPPALGKKRIRFGTFGWIQKAKRTKEIVMAFDCFLQGLDKSLRSNFELHLVGCVADPRTYNPKHWKLTTAKWNQNIYLTGYVTDDRFEELLKSMQCVINLRYPSCGETSGAFHKAKHLKIPIIGNDYNAFAENEHDILISCDPAREQDDLINAFRNIGVNTVVDAREALV